MAISVLRDSGIAFAKSFAILFFEFRVLGGSLFRFMFFPFHWNWVKFTSVRLELVILMRIEKSPHGWLRKPEQGLNFCFQDKESLPNKRELSKQGITRNNTRTWILLCWSSVGFNMSYGFEQVNVHILWSSNLYNLIENKFNVTCNETKVRTQYCVWKTSNWEAL